MNAIQRTRILRYKKNSQLLRYICKVIASILALSESARGRETSKRVLSYEHCGGATEAQKIYRAVLIHIYNDYRDKKYNLIHIGSFRGDELLKATKGFLSNSLNSTIYYADKHGATLSTDEISNQKPYVNIAWI
ncbi:MAG: hypothetical protein U5K79_17605 [Cyclobacteriaceae bacterium]|nr:hypothetical protein [Cyclobacteriaceae bacterium]